jgi:DNA processing protein
VDIIYPKENTRLAEQMLALGGALISEFPMNTFAAPQNSPMRNRIISGISIGVLVVEAAEYSGTRITSRCALEQNREVFAVVWEELPAPVRLALTPATGDESQAGKTASLFGESELPPHERQILKLLKADEATHIDEIVELLELDLSSSEIFAALFELELAGKVKQMPGKNFVKSF